MNAAVSINGTRTPYGSCWKLSPECQYDCVPLLPGSPVLQNSHALNHAKELALSPQQELIAFCSTLLLPAHASLIGVARRDEDIIWYY